MNEKLKAILLQLATDPLSLKTVQNNLASLPDNGLNDWEKQLRDAVKRHQIKNISGVFRYLFSTTPQGNQGAVTDELLKPIILAQAKLPADQRPSDFYNCLNLYSNQYFGGTKGSWLITILMGLPAKELGIILSQTSSDEVCELFICFNNNEVLEKLPAEIFLLFLQKLPLDIVQKLPLAEMAQRSGTVWDALADWFNQVAVNPPLGFWEFVKAQQLIKIAGFVNFLAMKSGTTLDFSKFSINNLHSDGPDTYLLGLLDDTLKFCQFIPANQMLVYGLLAVCIGRNQVLLKEIQTNTSSLNGESVELKIEELKKLKSRYEAASPFLKLLAEAKIFPQAIIETLGHSLNLPVKDICEYLQIAEFLPSTGVTKLETEASKPKPRLARSTTSSMPPPPYPGSSNTNAFTLPSFFPSSLPFFSAPTNRATTTQRVISPPSQRFNFQPGFVESVIIDDDRGDDSDDMKVGIISYVTGLDGYGSNEQAVLIDQATALYQANKANNPEIDAEGWVLQAIANQSDQSKPEKEKEEKEEKKRKRRKVSPSPLILSDDEGEDKDYEDEGARAKQEKSDRELAEQLDRQEKENSNRRTTNTGYNPVRARTPDYSSSFYSSSLLGSDDDDNVFLPREQEDFLLEQRIEAQENQSAVTRRSRPTRQNQPQQPFSAQSRRMITQPRQPEPFQLNPAVTIPVAIVLSLIIALSVCLSPLGAPLWLIPVIIVSGIYVATIFTLLFNCISKWSHTPPPSAPGIGYSEESEDAPYYPYNNPGLGPQSGNRYGNNALGFPQDDFWGSEDAINQSDSRTLAYDPENDYDNNFELIQ